MQTIDLECPSCSEMLELDAGFAGGVCRCSNCGTLMTVPLDAGRAAEQLSRPEPAGAASHAGEASTGSRGGSSTRARPSSRARKSSKKGKGKGKGKSDKPTPQPDIVPGEYRTTSGKVVRLDESAKIPMAQSKKKQIQLATAGIFFAVVLAITGLAIYVIAGMFGDDSDDQQQQDNAGPQETGPKYDRDANPYTLKFANLAGLPLKGKVAVVIENPGAENSFFRGTVNSVIVGGLKGRTGSASLSFFSATPGPPAAYNSGNAKAVSSIDTAKLQAWLKAQPLGSGSTDFDAAVKRAMRNSPGTLVIVAYSKSVNRPTNKKGVKVHVVHVNIAPPASDVESWVRQTGGQYVSLDTGKAGQWKAAAPAAEARDGE